MFKLRSDLFVLFFVTIPCNTSPSMRHHAWTEGVDESLHKICKHQQNVPQHYYLFDTLVYIRKLHDNGDQFSSSQLIFGPMIKTGFRGTGWMFPFWRLHSRHDKPMQNDAAYRKKNRGYDEISQNVNIKKKMIERDRFWAGYISCSVDTKKNTLFLFLFFFSLRTGKNKTRKWENTRNLRWSCFCRISQLVSNLY